MITTAKFRSVLGKHTPRALRTVFTSAMTACVVAGAITATLAVSACTADSGDPIVIIQNQVPAADCSVPASKTSAFLSRGVLDSTGRLEYLFTPIVESRTVVRDTADPLQRAVFVEGAEINLIVPDDAADVGALDSAGVLNFTQRFSGTISPGGSASFLFPIIPAQVTEAVAANLMGAETVEVLAEVTIFGELASGEVSSPTFSYPVAICSGCRVAAPSCVGYTLGAESACFPGQDADEIECCVSSGGALQCPPVPEDAPPAEM